MTKEDLEFVLQETIVKDLKHEHYDRVCKVADFAYSINTGEDQTEFIVNYRTESDIQKQSRVCLTNSYTPFIAGQIESVYKKSDRADNVKKDICHTEEAILKRINNKAEAFQGKKSFENYLRSKLRYYYFNDPNAWILFERKRILDNEGNQKDFKFYPFEVSSKQAINYHKENGVVQWLIVQHEKAVDESAPIENYTKPIESNDPPKKSKKKTEEKEITGLKIYYAYAAGYQIVYEEFKKEDLPKEDELNGSVNLATEDPNDETKKRYFNANYFENGSKEFPGLIAGNLPDLVTKGETFHTPLQTAEGILKDIMRDKSFLDVTKAKHTFLQKMVYGQPCNHGHSIHGECNEGCYGDTEIECKKCKGHGETWHHSDQEILAVQLPDGDKTPVPLETFASYIKLPHETPKFLSEELHKELSLVEQAVFNTQVLRNPIFGKTATEVVQLNENVYDALYEFDTLIGEAFCVGIRVCAQYLGKEVGLQVSYRSGRDYRLKDAATRIADYKAAREAGLDAKTLQELGYQVTAKVFQDDPTVLAEIKAFDCFKPFADKTVEEIAFILQDREANDPDRVLYENFDKIVKEIGYNLNNNTSERKICFSDLTLIKQKELIEEKVNEFADKIRIVEPIEDAIIDTE